VSGIRFTRGNRDPNLAIDEHDTNPAASENRIEMRGTFSDWCRPTLIIDGATIPDGGPDDIDASVQASDIAGIEIYTNAAAPAQFRTSLVASDRDACGVVVIWTRPRSQRGKP
jgi:hypothetical protein